MNFKTKKNLFLPVVLCIIAVACVVFCSCSQNNNDNTWNKLNLKTDTSDLQLIDNNTLTVAIAPGYKPYEYSEDGVLKGFDVDIANMVANSLGLKTKFIQCDFKLMFDNQLSDQLNYDCALSAITQTEEREELANLSDPYKTVHTKMIILANKDNNQVNEKNFDDLVNNKMIKVGAIEESSFAMRFYKQYPNVDIVVKSEPEDVTKMLANNEVDVIVGDEDVLKSPENSNKFKAVKEIDIDENIVIAVAKEKNNLLNAINEIIGIRHKDNTIKDIDMKYFKNNN